MHRKKLIFGSLALGAGLAATSIWLTRSSIEKPAAKSNTFDAIKTYIEEQMSRLHIPGAGLAIIEGDQIVRQLGFGKASPNGDVPTPQTPFFIGSLTKSITALAVMQLAEAGKVKLDAPVQQYLPWFHVMDLQASAEISVRHLLNQTSGLPALPGEIILADCDNHPDATERQVRDLSALRLAHPVGTKCEYSNLNYNILGLIIEAVSGEKYADYIQNHIFIPLDMRHSYTSRSEARQNGLATGYRHWFGLPFPAPELPIPRGSLPSGQLISCTEDMAHFLIAHLNGGCFADRQILSEPGFDELHRGVKEYIIMGISSGKYGMGWFDLDLSGVHTYTHSGNVPDFSAFMALIPEQKKGLVLLFNADPYGLPPITEEIGLNLTRLLSGQKPSRIRLDFVQWVMRLLPLIPLLQLADVAATVRRVNDWRAEPAGLPKNNPLWLRHILLPLVPNLALSASLAYLLSTRLIRFLRLFVPDLAWIAQICGSLSLLWSVFRTRLILQILHKS